jgi:hypothetical protein
VLANGLLVSAGRMVFPVKTQTLFDPFAEDIAIQETSVANSPNEEARRIEDDRLHTLGRAATAVAEARNAEATYGPRPIPVQSIKLTSQALGEIGQQQWGLIDNPSVPGSGSVFRPENAWKYNLGDGYILIIAGYSPANHDEGILLVDIDRNHMITSRTFIVPEGAIRIVRSMGMRLVLEAKNGDTLYFDVPGLMFVDSLEEVVPTSTWLIPEITPIFTKTPSLPYP